MKIYLILNDSVPYGDYFNSYLESKGFKSLNQITNCFTTTSVVSLLTGKLPSDLVKHGIAYHTHYNYKVNGRIDYPWKEQLLFKRLGKLGFTSHIHNASWFYLTICDDDYIRKTTSLDEGLDKADEFKATDEFTDILLKQSTSNSFYRFNKKFIKSAQEAKGKHCFFIKNHQYHQAIAAKVDKRIALDRIKINLDYFDFNEPDALFYIFSDHHNFTEIDQLCRCPSFLTNAYIKDNRKYSKSFPKCIHISDMFYYIMYIFNPPTHKDRVFFSEDARSFINLQCSSTAIASKFIDWDSNEPKRLLQVSYFKPDDMFYGFTYTLATGELEEVTADKDLQESLIRRFEWVR